MLEASSGLPLPSSLATAPLASGYFRWFVVSAPLRARPAWQRHVVMNLWSCRHGEAIARSLELKLIPCLIRPHHRVARVNLGARGEECWEALQVQIKAAADSNSFVLSHRQLDGAPPPVDDIADLCQ